MNKSAEELHHMQNIYVLFNCNAADLLIFSQLLVNKSCVPSDEPVPETEGGDREDHHDLHQGEGGQVQGPDHDAHRLRARLHEHQP